MIAAVGPPNHRASVRISKQRSVKCVQAITSSSQVECSNTRQFSVFIVIEFSTYTIFKLVIPRYL